MRLKPWKMKPIFSLRMRERWLSVRRLTSLAVEDITAGVELFQQPGDVQEGRLARARVTGDGDELAGLDLQTEVAQGMRFDDVGAKTLPTFCISIMFRSLNS